jgi:hypothetical protein
MDAAEAPETDEEELGIQWSGLVEKRMTTFLFFKLIFDDPFVSCFSRASEGWEIADSLGIELIAASERLMQRNAVAVNPLDVTYMYAPFEFLHNRPEAGLIGTELFTQQLIIYVTWLEEELFSQLTQSTVVWLSKSSWHGFVQNYLSRFWKKSRFLLLFRTPKFSLIPILFHPPNCISLCTSCDFRKYFFWIFWKIFHWRAFSQTRFVQN